MPRTADLPLAVRILREAREPYEKHDAFAFALAQTGAANPETGQPYTDSQISKWLKGHSEPPFAVILASARLAEFSIDRHLFPEEAGTDREDRETLRRHDLAIDQMAKEVKRLSLLVAKLAQVEDENEAEEDEES